MSRSVSLTLVRREKAETSGFLAVWQRWKEAFMARGEFGNEIVPKVVLGATHVRPSPFLSPSTSAFTDLRAGSFLIHRSTRLRRSRLQTCNGSLTLTGQARCRPVDLPRSDDQPALPSSLTPQACSALPRSRRRYEYDFKLGSHV